MIDLEDDLHILVAGPDEASGIAEIYTESILAMDSTMVLATVSTEDMRAKLDSLDPRETILAAYLNGSFVGWGIVKLYSDRPGYRLTCETSLFLRKDRRGRGIGSRLQQALIQQARDSGFHHIIVRIWAANEQSIGMHAKFGFEMVGVQKEVGHVDGRWIDVAVMQCILN